jgi:hypothetical protein
VIRGSGIRTASMSKDSDAEFQITGKSHYVVNSMRLKRTKDVA